MQTNQQVVARITASGPKKILACDGGGILGLISVEILAKVETDLRAKLGRGPEFVLADYFDFVCGTSTGAIIAACIASGMSMAKIRRFYLDSGQQMFDKALLFKRLHYSYNDEPLAKLLRAEFDKAVAAHVVSVHSPDDTIEVLVTAAGEITDVRIRGSLQNRTAAELAREVQAVVTTASEAARWARDCRKRPPRSSATRADTESNQMGPLPRTVFHTLAANAADRPITMGRSMCTMRARSPANAAW